MSNLPLQYDRLIALLPTYKSITQAIIDAGFSPSTARTQQKRVLASALRYQANKAINVSLDSTNKSKRLANELVGLSEQDVMKHLKKIATQDKDYSSALKVLGALSKPLGVTLQAEDTAQVTVPILNVVVKQNETEAPYTEQEVKEIHGSVEPL